MRSDSKEFPSRSELRDRVANIQREPQRLGRYKLQKVNRGLWMTINHEFIDDNKLGKGDEVVVYRDNEFDCLLVFPEEGADDE